MSSTLEERAAAFAKLPENDGGIVDDMLVRFAQSEIERLTNPKPRPKPTIAELDAILKDPEPGDVEILPNGEVIVNAELTRLRAEVAVLRGLLTTVHNRVTGGLWKTITISGEIVDELMPKIRDALGITP